VNTRARKDNAARFPELQVARSIVSGEVNEIRLVIRNKTSQEYELPGGTALAHCAVLPVFIPELGSDFCDKTAVSMVATTALISDQPSKLHPALEKLIEGAPIEEEYVPMLRRVLFHRQQAFSLNGELGYTDAVVHEINTGTAEPIRQQPRRLPIFATVYD